MAILKLHCSKCNAVAKFKSEHQFGSRWLRSFQCGHSELTDSRFVAEPSDVTQSDIDIINDIDIELDLLRFDDDGGVGYLAPRVDESFFSITNEFCAYPFQRDGVEFAERTNVNCLIADAMGLGKTVQALLTVKRNVPGLTPTLFCVKGSTQLQWCQQLKVWLDDSPLGVMPIMNRDCIIAGFNYYVISIDFLARAGVLERLAKLNFKLIVVDECQNFKNGGAKRTKALINFITECKIEHKLFLSGTPIKNRASEYFTILNLLDPVRFHSYTAFCKNWLVPNEKGVYTRIDPYMIDKFHELTSSYIIRREKIDVLKNLPPITRDYQYMVIDDPMMKDIYNNELDLFQNFQRTAGKINSTVLLGWLAKMRAITGQAKVPWAIEYTNDFLDNTEDSLALGIHHHSVRDTLYLTFKTKGIEPLKISGEENVYAKDRAQRKFNDGENRLLIINILAGGVGLNLQKHCSDFVVLERQWNSADEEQFEARFHRDGQKSHVNGVYPIASGTIDEWFHDGVARKRQICGETMNDKHYDIETDEDFLRELTEKTLANRL